MNALNVISDKGKLPHWVHIRTLWGEVVGLLLSWSKPRSFLKSFHVYHINGFQTAVLKYGLAYLAHIDCVSLSNSTIRSQFGSWAMWEGVFNTTETYAQYK